MICFDHPSLLVSYPYSQHGNGTYHTRYSNSTSIFVRVLLFEVELLLYGTSISPCFRLKQTGVSPLLRHCCCCARDKPMVLHTVVVMSSFLSSDRSRGSRGTLLAVAGNGTWIRFRCMIWHHALDMRHRGHKTSCWCYVRHPTHYALPSLCVELQGVQMQKITQQHGISSCKKRKQATAVLD